MFLKLPEMFKLRPRKYVRINLKEEEFNIGIKSQQGQKTLNLLGFYILNTHRLGKYKTLRLLLESSSILKV